MSKYKVEGWVQVIIPIDKEVTEPTKELAILKILKLIEKYTNGEIKGHELDAKEG